MPVNLYCDKDLDSTYKGSDWNISCTVQFLGLLMLLSTVKVIGFCKLCETRIEDKFILNVFKKVVCRDFLEIETTGYHVWWDNADFWDMRGTIRRLMVSKPLWGRSLICGNSGLEGIITNMMFFHTKLVGIYLQIICTRVMLTWLKISWSGISLVVVVTSEHEFTCNLQSFGRVQLQRTKVS